MKIQALKPSSKNYVNSQMCLLILSFIVRKSSVNSLIYFLIFFFTDEHQLAHRLESIWSKDQCLHSIELKTNQASSKPIVKAFEAPTIVNLRPPSIECHKSFDEDDIAAKPIVPSKKVNTAKIDARQYSIADLQMATDSFNVHNLIGEGSFGRVYRAQFDDVKVLAVKKINSSALQNPEDFLDIVSEISRLHHPNVTELVGYRSEHGQHLLVYEFHKNGSLYDFLHISDEESKNME